MGPSNEVGMPSKSTRAAGHPIGFRREEREWTAGGLPRTMATSTGETIHAVVLTPGMRGLGGISRMMDAVGEELGERGDRTLHVTFVDTRGDVKILRPLVFLKAIVLVAFACAFGRCDVLHINVASFGSTFRKILLSYFARASGVPYIVHLHGGGYREFWVSRGRLTRSAIDAFFRNASRVVVLGSMWVDLVREHVPEVAERIIILPNATRPPRKSRRGERGALTILFLGQLNASKGVPQLVEALAMLDSASGWRAILAGHGDLAQTRAQVEQLGLSGRVDVPGWVGPERVEELLLRADIFVLPSFVENQPLSIIEAFAYGVPVVCTPVGSVPEIVTEGRTGLFVPVGDSAALSRALCRLIEDPRLRMRLALNAASEHATRFQLSSYVDRLVGEWRAAARTRQGAHPSH